MLNEGTVSPWDEEVWQEVETGQQVIQRAVQELDALVMAWDRPTPAQVLERLADIERCCALMRYAIEQDQGTGAVRPKWQP